AQSASEIYRGRIGAGCLSGLVFDAAKKEMKKFLRFTWVALALGCRAHHGPLSIFKKSSPHDTYGQHLSDAGLAGSALARNWQQQAGAPLASLGTIELPYQETGYFPAERSLSEVYDGVLKRG